VAVAQVPAVTRVTGERVSTDEGGFNPTFRRHVAAYRAAAELIPAASPVLDLGCGVGHSFTELAPRETVGVDLDPAALEGQDRETHAADMRRLPLADGRFASVVSVHSLEHVPDPERVLAEVVRVLAPGGTAVFVTPNRLTFARADEIIDPYHYREYDADELAALCRPHFAEVRVLGLAGSERYRALVAAEHARLDRLLGRDPLRARRLVPRRVRQLLYDLLLTRARRDPDPAAAAITEEDFFPVEDGLAEALDVIAVCRRS
jgi:SAM-dependent methyltransferase